MPKGQDRYANRSRKRSPRRGQTTQVNIGKKIGVAPLVGEYDDVRRYLKGLIDLGLSADNLKRLGKWCVLMAEAEGFTPETDVLPEIQQVLELQLHRDGILPADGERNFKPADCLRLEPESSMQRWEREAEEHDQKTLRVEELEEALKLARKYGELDLVAVLEQNYDAEEAERIKRERYNFSLRYLDVLDATYSRGYFDLPVKERERTVHLYGPQTAEFSARRKELLDQVPTWRSKKQNRDAGRLVGSPFHESGWSDPGIYSSFRKLIQRRGHQLGEDE